MGEGGIGLDAEEGRDAVHQEVGALVLHGAQEDAGLFEVALGNGNHWVLSQEVAVDGDQNGRDQVVPIQQRPHLGGDDFRVHPLQTADELGVRHALCRAVDLRGEVQSPLAGQQRCLGGPDTVGAAALHDGVLEQRPA